MPDACVYQLILGRVDGQELRLTAATLEIARRHARQIAADLGTHDAESSLAAYWALEPRLLQWQRIIDHIGLEQARRARFVEVGSGMGLFTVTGRALGFNIVGVESSSDRYQASLRAARSLFRDNDFSPCLVQGLAEALPIPDASVDLVASFQTIEHVQDLQRTLCEIRRILRPGGIFFAQAPNYSSFYEAHYGVLAPLGMGKTWMRRYLRLLGRPVAFLEHLQWISPRQLRVLLAAAGFSSVHIGTIRPPSYVAGRIPAMSYPLPFHFRRGALTRRLAHGFALALNRLGLSHDRYPQLEIWAVA